MSIGRCRLTGSKTAPPLLIMLLSVLSCQSSTDAAIEADDLLGSWRSITLNGVAELSFSRAKGLNRYVFSAPNGDFGSITLNPGSNVLSRGWWSVTGNVLALTDEDGFPLACPESDRYIVEMSAARTVFTLASVATANSPCLTRSQILGESGWLAQAEGES